MTNVHMILRQSQSKTWDLGLSAGHWEESEEEDMGSWLRTWLLELTGSLLSPCCHRTGLTP